MVWLDFPRLRPLLALIKLTIYSAILNQPVVIVPGVCSRAAIEQVTVSVDGASSSQLPADALNFGSVLGQNHRGIAVFLT